MSAYLRDVLGPLLSEYERGLMAAALNVTPERLAQALAQGDDFFPLFPDDLPIADPSTWPMPFRAQGDFIAYTQQGYAEVRSGGAGGDKTYKYRSLGPVAAANELREWGATGNPFFDDKIRRGVIKQDAEGWYIEIDVANEYFVGGDEPGPELCDVIDEGPPVDEA